MAAVAETVDTPEVLPAEGKAVGNTTRGATAGAQVAVAAGSGAALIITWALVHYGIEDDPATAGLLGVAIAGVFNQAAAFVGARWGGKNAPTDQGDAKVAKAAVIEVNAMVERLAAAQAASASLPVPQESDAPESSEKLEGREAGAQPATEEALSTSDDVWEYLGVDVEDTSAAGTRANA